MVVTNDNIRSEIDEYLRLFEDGFSTDAALASIQNLLNDASQDQKNRALHYAAKMGEPKLLDIIIDTGADVNSIIEKQTPMMAAIIDPDSGLDKQESIIETLLDRGANPSEVVDEKSIDDIIDDIIDDTNTQTSIEILKKIKEMIDKRKDRIEGGKRKRKRTKKNKKRRKQKSIRTRKRRQKSAKKQKVVNRY